jgi:hypothetical protein
MYEIESVILPACGLIAPGHDVPDPVALGTGGTASGLYQEVEELHHEIGTRFVLVIGGVPRVVHSHLPARVLSEWERAKEEIGTAFEVIGQTLRFPRMGLGDSVVISVSPDPVRCLFADAANAEAFRRFAERVAAESDGVVEHGEGGVAPTT